MAGTKNLVYSYFQWLVRSLSQIVSPAELSNDCGIFPFSQVQMQSFKFTNWKKKLFLKKCDKFCHRCDSKIICKRSMGDKYHGVFFKESFFFQFVNLSHCICILRKEKMLQSLLSLDGLTTLDKFLFHPTQTNLT